MKNSTQAAMASPLVHSSSKLLFAVYQEKKVSHFCTNYQS